MKTLGCIRFAAAALCAVLLAILTVACHDKRQLLSSRVRSVYYWSTTLNIDSTKTAFLRAHGISRMYVRYFDVVADASGRAVPNATLNFATAMPHKVDIVPTVFVMPECLRGDRKQLASLIVKRVLQKNETNDVKDVKEIQIDCDWTLSTRRLYNDFMQAMLDECHSRQLQLSSTIRLHQLAQTPPPADRGVLMMYNTGDATDIRCHKPILDLHDAAPYLPYLKDYKLSLSAAYPVFTWRIQFRGGQFVSPAPYDGEYPILSSDSIVIRQPSLSDIISAVNVIGSRRPEANDEIILFDLNNNNINRLNYDEYERIFNN